MNCWLYFLDKVFDDFENNFNHRAEMIIITIPNKLDKSYDYYIKHNM